MAQPNGRPLSADPNINTTTAPPSSTSDSFATTDSNHISISLDQGDSQFGDATFDSTSFGATDFGTFDPSNSFSQQSSGVVDPSFAFNAQQSQQQFLSGDADFSLFPAGASQADFNTPLFENNALSPGDMNTMASPSSHHTASPPGLLQPDGSIGSAQHSPSYNQQQFPHNVGQHSRNVSLGPEAALLPGQHDWSLPQFQVHRRSPSEFSDVSSAAPSPNLISSDNFDADISGHSPLQRPSDGSLYQEVIGISNFTIADAQANLAHGRSPSHSPAISPRIPPANMPEVNQQFGLTSGYMTTPAYPTIQGPLDDYSVQTQMAPSINIDYAPTNARQGPFESNKSPMNQDSLAPPDRGRVKSRPRSVTDPFQQGASVARSHSSGSGAQTLGADLGARQDVSRSLSPLDRRSASASSRNRRQSTSSVPNNVIALRLADPDYQGQEAGSAKRVQKHPATFQCTLCPKRFTRAYNLRSHLRTHTDERPFVCTVCGKAFARQHDRKRHESLHSGEKKFVCKGDLKAGGQWGCGRRFARADALGRHFRSEAGRICIKPLLDEEMVERQRTWQEQNVQQNLAAQQQPQMDTGYPMDASGNMVFPAALLAQYPALAQMNWGADMSGNNSGLEDELSGRSSFDASDYDELEDGYASASGSGIAQFGEVGF